MPWLPCLGYPVRGSAESLACLLLSTLQFAFSSQLSRVSSPCLSLDMTPDGLVFEISIKTPVFPT
jgi:hypothetical protein